MKKVYEPFKAPILVTDINSAELIKHAANSFLSLKISYINAVSAICEASGADVEKVADGIGMDRRIGRELSAMPASATAAPVSRRTSRRSSPSASSSACRSSCSRKSSASTRRKRTASCKAMREALWVLRDKKIAVWGLTFKPDTDDIRSSVAIDLVAEMLREGAHVTAYDPKGMEKAREVKLDRGSPPREYRAGSGGGRRGAHPRHGVEGVCQRGSRSR